MRIDYRNVLLVVASSVLTLAFIEGLLRVVLANRPDLLVQHHQDREFIASNPYWKYWHYPNNRVYHQSDCFSAEYTTNSLGFKYGEIDNEKPTIALLGDSFVEGYGVSNDGTVTHFLDSLFERRFQFVPFATSGGFGTAHEYALYENFARFYQPDLVILFFLNYNDFYDNLNALDDDIINANGALVREKVRSLEEVQAAIGQLRDPKAMEHDVTFYSISLAHTALRFIGNIVQYASNVKGNFKSAYAEIYAVDEVENITKAHELTARILKNLNLGIRRDSTNLLLVNLFDPYQVDEKWMEVMSSKIDKKMRPTYPNEKIALVCEKEGIAYLDLYPLVKEEISRRNMKFPYFSQSCDNHLTREGNRWLAQTLFTHLKERRKQFF